MAQNMLLTEHIVELVYVYGISFMHIFIISMFILTLETFLIDKEAYYVISTVIA